MTIAGQKAEWIPDKLEPEHIEGCRIFANRNVMMEFLAARVRGGSIAEIGVEYGDFSAFMIETLAPAMFHGYDLFHLDLLTEYGHRRPRDILGMRSHKGFIEHKFASQIATGTFQLFEGDSSYNLMKQPDQTYDLIYIDGDHRLAGVTKDVAAARLKIKPGGLLIFNDYSMWDCTREDDPAAYGVVQCVNHLCVQHGWRMVAFALQRMMFCDVALMRG
jgi:hypothetical protein